MWNVDGMVRDMPAHLLHRWEYFSELEPFGEERMDLRFARLEAAMYNIHTRKDDDPLYPVERFLLRVGDVPPWKNLGVGTSTVPQWQVNKDKLVGLAYAWAALKSKIKKKGP